MPPVVCWLTAKKTTSFTPRAAPTHASAAAAAVPDNTAARRLPAPNFGANRATTGSIVADSGLVAATPTGPAIEPCTCASALAAAAPRSPTASSCARASTVPVSSTRTAITRASSSSRPIIPVPIRC